MKKTSGKTTCEERARALLKQLSLEEKVNQLTCTNVKDVNALDFPATGTAVLGVVREGNFYDAVKKVQSYIIGNSPHRIPALIHAEGLSGPVCLLGGCQYPAPIGLGATFEPELVEEMAKFTSRQLAANGIRHALSPVLDLARELRWGRCNETYGGDPTLCASFSVSFIKGMQGEDLTHGVAATCKHFLGYSISESGLNMHQTVLPYKVIREQIAKPFEAAINLADVKCVMNSYSAVEGLPVTANKKILNDLLRDGLGFKGTVVSDYSSVNQIMTVYRLADNIEDTARLALNAGLDVEYPNRKFYADELIAAVKEGRIAEELVDRSVLRLLTLKFELGLFENPYGVGNYDEAMDNTLPDEGSLKTTRKSITLLKNDGILPLTDKKAKVAVIGPCANTLRLMYGHYTAVGAWEILKIIDAIKAEGENADFVSILNQGAEGATKKIRPRTIESKYIFDGEIRKAYPKAKTLYEGLKDKFENAVFTEGCDYKGNDKSGFEKAQKLAKTSDFVVLCVGEKSGIDPSCSSGEGVDCTSLTLPGVQDELVKAVHEVNKNCIIVHTGCKPLCNEWVYENIPAVIEAWFPATFGGQAVAEVICGEYNPAGRTPVDLPRSAGHSPVYFSQFNGSVSEGHENFGIKGYTDSLSSPLLPFGYGLSYTTFAYGAPELAHDGNGNISISVKVTNTGARDGEEVVQLYGKDEYACTVRPKKELVGFKRIALKAGASKKVTFKFNINILSFVNADGQWIAEAGDFTFFVGGNSNADKTCTYRLDKTVKVNPNKRDFFALAEAE
ncbi:MAG: glycoside hydrolase family 3 C-terminal domain-containing protein [Clostridia bacterium]|nr:glycoside hydrolase family 3 C-terminal domain-containing protein [Clostridia bacterium]